MITTTTPGGQRVSICTCTQMGRHLATFTRQPGSSLYTLATEPPQIAASAQVSASGQVAASCSCRLLSHQTLLWHHRLGHPSLPRLRGMHSRLLVSGLPKSLPPLPPSRAPPCLPCVEGRQRAASHSSSFPSTTAPLQTLHMDVKGEVSDVLIPWIRTVRLQLREWFGQDLLVLRLHSDRGGEFSSDLLRDFCRGEGILQSFTLPDSPQQNGIAERRIGLVMEGRAVDFEVWIDDLQLFLQCDSKDGLSLFDLTSGASTAPAADADNTVRTQWTTRDAAARLAVRSHLPSTERAHFSQYKSAKTLYDAVVARYSSPATAALSRLMLPYMFPDLAAFATVVDLITHLRTSDTRYRAALPADSAVPSGVSQVDPLSGIAPVQVAVGSGAAPGAASGGASSGGAEPGGAGSEGAGSGGAEPGGAEPEVVELGSAESEGAESGGAEPRAPGAGGARDTRPGGAAVTTRADGTRGTAATSPGGARTSGAGAAWTSGVGCAGAGDPTELGAAGARGAGAGVAGVGGLGVGGARAAGAGVGDTGAGGTGAAGAGVVDPGDGDAGDTVRPRPYFVPLLQQVLGVPSSTGPPPPFLCPSPD
ncbi:unnamed protein product [Closterium sp. NIES-54]